MKFGTWTIEKDGRHCYAKTEWGHEIFLNDVYSTYDIFEQLMILIEKSKDNKNIDDNLIADLVRIYHKMYGHLTPDEWDDGIGCGYEYKDLM